MIIYLASFEPEFYENESSYIIGAFDTMEKAIDAIREEATIRNEPALALEHEFDTWAHAECYHYEGYNGSRYYITELEVK